MKITKDMLKYLKDCFEVNSFADLTDNVGVVATLCENALNGYRMDQRIMAIYFNRYAGDKDCYKVTTNE